MTNEKDIVRRGYDKVSFVYRGEDQSDPFGFDYNHWLAVLGEHLRPAAKILDLGCGCGIPTSSILASKYEITGIDISPVQITRAKNLIPQANFLCADMTKIDFPAASFNAVVAFYSIIHVPLDEQPGLLQKVYQWLTQDAYFMVIVGDRDFSGTENDWLGVKDAKMYWSHTDFLTYCQWFKEIGYSLIWNKFIPEGDSGHQLMLLSK
jgi:ubiquinone/menaquinone biosynthesis C-methylase UbiE